MSAKQQIWTLISPAISIKFAECILRISRDVSQYNSFLASGEVQSMGTWACATPGQRHFNRLLLARTDPSNGTAQKRVWIAVHANSVPWTRTPRVIPKAVWPRAMEFRSFDNGRTTLHLGYEERLQKSDPVCAFQRRDINLLPSCESSTQGTSLSKLVKRAEIETN